MKHVILPRRNEPDLDEVPPEILKALEIHLVSRVDEVLPIALAIATTDGGGAAPSPPSGAAPGSTGAGAPPPSP